MSSDLFAWCYTENMALNYPDHTHLLFLTILNMRLDLIARCYT